MYTVIDLLRDQGIEKGMEQGIEKGRQEGRQEDIEKLLKGILSPEEIASALEVDLAWVEEIARKNFRK
jgi:predicted transposase/invertase (TIGR01784 family)